jgi:hypothetical protein
MKPKVHLRVKARRRRRPDHPGAVLGKGHPATKELTSLVAGTEAG